jgi:hypothetical protein
MVETSGAYIFQLEELKRTPFDQVKPQIESMLTNERLRTMMESVVSSVKPEMNPAYFRMIGAEAGNQPSTPMPSNAIRPAHPTAAPQSSPAPK